MESMFGKLWRRICTQKSPKSIMIVGLDNSGKTSILNNLLSLSTDGSRTIPSTNQTHQVQSSWANDISRTSSSAQMAGESQQLYPTSDQNVTTASIRATTTGIARNGQETDVADGNITPTVGYNYEKINYNRTTMTVLDFSGHTRYRNLWQEFYNAVDAIVFVIDSSDLIRLVVVRDEIETMLGHPYLNSLGDQTLQPVPSKLPSSVSLMLAQTKLTIKQGRLVQSPLGTGSNLTLANADKPKRDHLDGSDVGKSQTVDSNRRTKVPILFLANKSDLATSIDKEVIVKALNLNKLPADRHPWSIYATSVNLSQGIIDGFNWLIRELETK